MHDSVMSEVLVFEREQTNLKSEKSALFNIYYPQQTQMMGMMIDLVHISRHKSQVYM